MVYGVTISPVMRKSHFGETHVVSESRSQSETVIENHRIRLIFGRELFLSKIYRHSRSQSFVNEVRCATRKNTVCGRIE